GSGSTWRRCWTWSRPRPRRPGTGSTRGASTGGWSAGRVPPPRVPRGGAGVAAAPVSPPELRARLLAALRMRGYLDEIARQRSEMDGLRRQMDALAGRMAEDLRVAGGIQRSLLPPPVEHPRLDLAREYIPFREIGGDYYDFVPLREQALALAVGDVMGKGVSAALLAATLKASVRSQLQTGEISWSGLVSPINRLFSEVPPGGLFASLFFGVFDASGRSFAYVNGGHVHPFVVR